MLLFITNQYAPFGIFGFQYLHWIKPRNTAGFYISIQITASQDKDATLADSVIK